MRLAAASGWSPYSCAMWLAQPGVLRRRMVLPIASATTSAVGASEGCMGEANSASQTASLMVIPVTLASGVRNRAPVGGRGFRLLNVRCDHALIPLRDLAHISRPGTALSRRQLSVHLRGGVQQHVSGSLGASDMSGLAERHD